MVPRSIWPERCPAGRRRTSTRSSGGQETLAFVVVHRDRLVYERYFGGSDRATLQTSFSVAKSFLSTLVGIAIDEGLDRRHRRSGHRLSPRARGTRRTVRTDTRSVDLLTMSSGLRYEEPDIPVPWGDDVVTYYGVDLRDVGINGSQVGGTARRDVALQQLQPAPPGDGPRASHVDVGLATTWPPGCGSRSARRSTRLGRSTRRRSGFEKLESGLNIRARRLRRASGCCSSTTGSGTVHGSSRRSGSAPPRRRIRPPIRRRTTSTSGGSMSNARAASTGSGTSASIVYVAPDADAVIVRNGSDWNIDNDTWLGTFREIDRHAARVVRGISSRLSRRSGACSRLTTSSVRCSRAPRRTRSRRRSPSGSAG